ncbi:hypothetical protein CEXT_643471 [Caerostris extrusa]|uniref:DNA-directed RNA polymerase III subunit RPC3 n=1 Tax=Caerostris extrusa TaxID=172846 RepID=A0AAV4RMI7_CAEEX|nr:hypothetical protein CEXT_643471 [Caerostris extrusa]
MSETLTSLCSALLREYFGEIVEKVGTFLMKQFSSFPLYLIRLQVALPLNKVKSALCVLIQHNFCEFVENEKELLNIQYNQKMFFDYYIMSVMLIALNYYLVIQLIC